MTSTQESPMWHRIFYTCPVCETIEMKTEYLVLAHHDKWEYRESVEPCVLCKRDEERMKNAG